MVKKIFSFLFVFIILITQSIMPVYADGKNGGGRDTSKVDSDIFPTETNNGSLSENNADSTTSQQTVDNQVSSTPEAEQGATEETSNVEGEITNITERNNLIRYVIRISDSDSVAVYADPQELGINAETFAVGDYVNFTYNPTERTSGYYKLDKLQKSTQTNHSFGSQATSPTGELDMQTPEPTATPTVTPLPENTNQQVIDTTGQQVEQEAPKRNIAPIATAIGVGSMVALFGVALIYFVRNKSKVISSGYYDDYE